MKRIKLYIFKEFLTKVNETMCKGESYIIFNIYVECWMITRNYIIYLSFGKFLYSVAESENAIPIYLVVLTPFK